MSSQKITARVEHFLSYALECQHAPQQVIDSLTTPEHVQRWWDATLEFDPTPGAPINLHVAGTNHHLRGTTVMVSAQELWFTALSDHDATISRTVGITVRESFDGQGFHFTLRHGPFGENIEEQAELNSARELWDAAIPALMHDLTQHASGNTTPDPHTSVSEVDTESIPTVQ